MKDIHCHILFGIDDGSYNLEESILIIEKAISNGYTDLILTPHYRFGQNYIADNNKKMKYFACLEDEVKRRNLKIRIYLGNEITLDDDFFYYLKTNQITSLNSSKYLLLELPFFKKVSNLDEIFDKIMSLGYKIIIAHPERYERYKVEDYQKMVEKGILLQGNMGTLFGKYGTVAEEKLKEMLRCHMIHFMGSDVHYAVQAGYSRVGTAIEKIEALTEDSEMTQELFNTNIEKVINNQNIEVYPIRKRITKVKKLRNLIKLK